MNLRSPFLFAGAFLLAGSLVRSESPATNAPPGAVEPQSSAAAQPETSAPPQSQTKSGPGAASPNGANGTTVVGKKVTKSPKNPKKKTTKDELPVPGAPAAAAASTVASAAAPAPAVEVPVSVLDNYLQDLTDALKLSADEKKDIQTYYLKDGPSLQAILNDATVSALDQADQVSKLRDERNDTIEALLGADDRRREFLKVEAIYRVALTEAAADGKLNPAQPLPSVPAPTDVTPGTAEPTPSPKNPVL